MREMQARDLWASFKSNMVLDPGLSEQWDHAGSLRVDDPIVVGVAAALGLDRQALDQFFRDAGKR